MIVELRRFEKSQFGEHRPVGDLTAGAKRREADRRHKTDRPTKTSPAIETTEPMAGPIMSLTGYGVANTSATLSPARCASKATWPVLLIATQWALSSTAPTPGSSIPGRDTTSSFSSWKA
jgi:hypothetical protein